MSRLSFHTKLNETSLENDITSLVLQ